MSQSDIAISVRGLSKVYQIAREKKEQHSTLAESLLHKVRNLGSRGESSTESFHALKDISFDIQKGDVVGIIGRNGAGKSTLLKVLSRITEPTTGTIDLYGRVGSLLEVGTGFHPELTGRENIFLNGAILGMSKVEINKQFDEIVDFSGVAQFLDTPVKRYSSGMYVRLAFAVAAHLNTEILIVDEVLAVGDAEFQRKCLGKMKAVATGGRTVLFVSHHLQSVSVLCNQALYMDKGACIYNGEVAGAFEIYLSTFAKGTDTERESKDRPGSGQLRFTMVAPAKVRFDCGEEKRISFSIEKRAGFDSHFFISCHVVDAQGYTILQCDSRLMGRWFDIQNLMRGEFLLRHPWLKPGSYTVDLFICSSGVIDKYEQACSIEVSPVLPYPAAGNSETMQLGVVMADFDFAMATDDPARIPNDTSS